MQPYKISNEYLEHLHPRAVEQLETWVNNGGSISVFWQYLLAGQYKDAAFLAGPDFLNCFAWLIICIEQEIPQSLRSSHEAINHWKGYNNGEEFNPKIQMQQKLSARDVNLIRNGQLMLMNDNTDQLE